MNKTNFERMLFDQLTYIDSVTQDNYLLLISLQNSQSEYFVIY